MKILGLDLGVTSIGISLIDDEKKNIEFAHSHIFPLGNNLVNGLEKSKNEERSGYRMARRNRMRAKLRRKNLKNALSDLNMLPSAEPDALSTEIYRLRNKALIEKIELTELGKIFLHINNHRGFKSNRKEKAQESESKSKEQGVVKEGIASLEKEIEKHGFLTHGQYFWWLIESNPVKNKNGFAEHPIERIRCRFISREMYEKEFDLIWNKQKQYYPEILTGSSSEKLDKESAYFKIKNYSIFYQRPLKSQKDKLANCPFEPKKKVTSRASFEFQEFRIWQFISNIRIDYQDRVHDILTKEEKLKLATFLMDKENASPTEMKKVLELPKAKLNLDKNKYEGNRTRAKLINALGKEKYDFLEKEYLSAIKTDENSNSEDKYNLSKTTKLYNTWHAIYFANDDIWLKNHLINKLKYSEIEANTLTQISFEVDYCKLSVKAIRPILAYMKEGYDYAEACQYAGYDHSLQINENRILEDKIAPLKNNELRNPVVQMALSETIRVVNKVITQYGKPDIIRIETTREAKKSKEQRENITRANREVRERRERYVDTLKKYKPQWEIHPDSSIIKKYELWLEMGVDESDLLQRGKDEKFISDFLKFAKQVSIRDKERYELWMECNRISPYSGKTISLTKLFSSEIEIEHIIPFSRSLDDSFSNKTLCESDINKDKDKRTPFEYFSSKSKEDWMAFQNRISVFNDHKREKFLLKEVPKEFDSGSLRDTSYIATEAVKKLQTVCKTVQMTNGTVTSFLRRQWGLDAILNKESDEIKNRGDHRHHAVDAVVIAFAGPKYVQLVSNHSKFNDLKTFKEKPETIPTPWDTLEGFRKEIENHIDGILVSFRNKKRLITSKKNKTWYRNEKGELKTKTSKSISIRGSMHEDTNYGQIQYPNNTHEKIKNGDAIYVTRKPLSYFSKIEQLEKVIDAKVREVLILRLRQYDMDFKKAFSDIENNPVWMYSINGAKVPIKKVRVLDSAEEMIPIKPKENPKLFVSPGNNYIMAIYEDKKTKKRDYEIATFYEASKKKLKKEPIIEKQKEGKNLLFTLKQHELFVIYENHQDEINWNDKKELSARLYKVVKFTGGRIYLSKHILTNVKVDKDPQPLKLYPGYIGFNAIKVQVSITGEIKKCEI
ncbi:MAG: HNH endonuclease domain-containing protein [Bacteroidota bacterium]|nr:HNH endonuclease domain-containing protein [Bacteroidota bacterium]